MKNTRLPYINNAKAVLITIVINIGVVFIFNWPNGVSYQDVLWDSLFCALITTCINMWVVYVGIQKLKSSGQMPQQAPVSRLMQRLPRNPFLLGLIFAAVFAALTIGINALILHFFDFPNMAFIPWMVYKLIYATVLSIKIVEFCIFRYVQSDCYQANEEVIIQPIKNPLPKISVFKEMYGSVTGNIALNIIFGYFLGGSVIQLDGSVVLFPATIEGIPISGLVFGCITGIIITNAYLKAMKATIMASGAAILESVTRSRFFTLMPKRRGALTCVTTLSVMIFSAIMLPLILHLFGKTFLNFYQFCIFITVYASLIAKPLSYILVKRCMQPDYIHFTLNKMAHE